MPIIKEVEGNLLDMFDNQEFNAIVHGCNCQANMGAGIAKQIADRYPIAALQDQLYEHNARMIALTESPTQIQRRKNESMGGTISVVHLPHAVSSPDTVVRGNVRQIVNAYTQYYPGNPQTDECRLTMITEAFWKVNGHFAGKIVGIPMIGAGLAGGDWEIISRLINRTTPDVEITLVKYKP